MNAPSFTELARAKRPDCSAYMYGVDGGHEYPPFALADDQVRELAQLRNPDRLLVLEILSHAHYYNHRPIIGLPMSLHSFGMARFSEAWSRDKARFLAEADAVFAEASRRAA